MDLEPVHAGHVALGALGGDQGRVDLEDDVVEGCAEVGTVDGRVPGGFGVVRVLAARAVEFDGLEVRDVGETHGEERVGVTHDSGAFPELGFLVLVELLREGLVMDFSTCRRQGTWSSSSTAAYMKTYHF